MFDRLATTNIPLLCGFESGKLPKVGKFTQDLAQQHNDIQNPWISQNMTGSGRSKGHGGQPK